MNNNNVTKRKASKMFAMIVLPLVLVVAAICGVLMTNQNTTAFASEFDAIRNGNTASNIVNYDCSDSIIMQHARPIDLSREFYLDRISVIMKHRYSINHNVSQSRIKDRFVTKIQS